MIGLRIDSVPVMVHPTQQRPLSPSRRPPPCLTFARNGKVTSIKVRPWAAAVGLSALALCLTAYIGATAYLIYRDDLLGATLARQVNMQYAYEDRIAALRSEIDRVTSRYVVAAQGVEEQVATLLRRQAEIEGRQDALDDLAEKARGIGIEVASTEEARAPRPRPAVALHSKSRLLDPALGYAPGATPTNDAIRATLMRTSDAQGPVELRGDLQPLLLSVGSSLENAARQQAVALDTLRNQTEGEAAKLSAALAPIGVNIATVEPEGPQGGPFIPAGALHFVERTAILNRTLDDIAALHRAAAGMPLRAPVGGTAISSRFGYRTDPFLRSAALHSGLDFVAATGTSVRATAPGTVVSAGPSGGYGNMVEIRHAGGVSTRYAHLSAVLVEQGAEIKAGEVIGRVGSTGRSTGPHLHYETRRDGQAIDPTPYLEAGQAL